MLRLLLALGILEVSCLGPAFAEEILLTKAGKPGVYLVLDERMDERNRVSVEDFLDIIRRARGVSIPRESKPGLLPLYVGEPAEFASLPIEAPQLDEEAFYLKIGEEGIFVLGGSSLGTQHGVYTLLLDLGFRWVMPGEIGESFPEGPSLSLPCGERVESPDFCYRELSYGCSPEGAQRLRTWQRRNRMHRPLVQHGHNLSNTLSRVVTYEERPELYALIEGERKETQICTANPEVVKFVIQSIREYLDKHPEVKTYSLCPNDNWDFCECERCRDLDVEHMDRGGMPSVSDRYQVFMNSVLDGLAETHPSVQVSTYSYNPNHTDPPQKTPVHPNTAIFATTNMFCCAHGVGDLTCPSRRDFLTLLGEWRDLTDHVYIYEYDPEPYCGGLPWPLWKAHLGAFPLYKELGIKGVMLAGQNSWSAYSLDYYIAAQLLWESSADPEALLDNLFEIFFGEAAEDMWDHYEALGSHFFRFKEKAEWGMVDYPQYFPPKAVEESKKALERAESRNTSPIVRQRLEMARLGFDVFETYLKLLRADSSTNSETYKRSLDHLDRTLNRLSNLNEDFLDVRMARAKLGIALSKRFAREQGFVNRWLLCGVFDNLGMDGHERVYPPEEEIRLDAKYVGKDGRSVQWRENRTPEDRGYVDLLEEYETTEWVCTYALCWLKVTGGPKDVVFRVGSNDSIKVFLNGEVVWDHKAERVASVDDDLIPVTLPAGVSTVMLKIGQAGLNWGFYFRISGEDSVTTPEGIEVLAAPPDSKK